MGHYNTSPPVQDCYIEAARTAQGLALGICNTLSMRERHGSHLAEWAHVAELNEVIAQLRRVDKFLSDYDCP